MPPRGSPPQTGRTGPRSRTRLGDRPGPQRGCLLPHGKHPFGDTGVIGPEMGVQRQYRDCGRRTQSTLRRPPVAPWSKPRVSIPPNCAFVKSPPAFSGRATPAAGPDRNSRDRPAGWPSRRPAHSLPPPRAHSLSPAPSLMPPAASCLLSFLPRYRARGGFHCNARPFYHASHEMSSGECNFTKEICRCSRLSLSNGPVE